MLVTGLPVWQSLSENAQYVSVFLLFLFLFFSMSVKVLPVNPLPSGVFMQRVFCAYFVRVEGVGVDFSGAQRITFN